MSWLSRFWSLLHRKDVNSPVAPPAQTLSQYYSPAEVYAETERFLQAEDLVFFPHFNAYCAFKYPVVKDILSNNTDIGVSDVHLELNEIYFSLNEEIHQQNKKAAVRHLDFLAKDLLKEHSVYVENLFHIFISKISLNTPVDLRRELINPIVFLHALNDFGFADIMPEFDIFQPHFNHQSALTTINDIFTDTSALDRLFRNYFRQGGSLPVKMQAFVQDIQCDRKLKNEEWAGFFRSMMFSATESTSSFICSLVLTLANQFPTMLENVQHHEQLVPIANEVLRIYTPVPYIYRTVRKQTLYAGLPLNVGDTVIVFIGSANLDPTHFDEPRLVKLDRKEKHLSFGKGPYACIGQTYSMRLALNVIHCLAESQYKLMPVNGEESSQIYNGMIRVPMHFVLKNKSDVRK